MSRYLPWQRGDDEERLVDVEYVPTLLTFRFFLKLVYALGTKTEKLRANARLVKSLRLGH